MGPAALRRRVSTVPNQNAAAHQLPRKLPAARFGREAVSAVTT